MSLLGSEDYGVWEDEKKSNEREIKMYIYKREYEC